MIRILYCISIAVISTALFAMPAISRDAIANNNVNTGYFGGVAIKGYDPVAYFTKSRALPGSEDHQAEFLGEIWLFASEDHRQLFEQNPVKYAPQYGGFCAGEALHAFGGPDVVTNIDPEAWRIIDDKLYLFYDKATAELFDKDTREKIEQADKNWSKIHEAEPTH